MKNDYFWILPVAALTLFVCVICTSIGVYIEGYRIYDKCMETNKTMIHQEAVKLCKEIVK